MHTMATPTRRRTLVAISALLAAILTAVWLAYSFNTPSIDARSALWGAAISPGTLAVVDATPEDARNIAVAAKTYCNSAAAQRLQSAVSAYQEILAADPLDKSTTHPTESDLDSARSAIDQQLDKFVAAVTKTLTAAQQEQLRIIRRQATSGMPLEYLTVSRSHEETTLIRNATMRTAENSGVVKDPRFLAIANSHPVLEAKRLREQNTPSIKAVWEVELPGPPPIRTRPRRWWWPW